MSMPQKPQILDLMGLKCPLPALKTGKALETLAPGATLEVWCNDPMTVIDIPHLVQSRGDVLLRQQQEGTKLTYLIRKAG